MTSATWEELLAAYAARLDQVEAELAGTSEQDSPPAPPLPPTPAHEPTAEQRQRLIALMERNAAAQSALAARLDEARAEIDGLGIRRAAAREYARTG